MAATIAAGASVSIAYSSPSNSSSSSILSSRVSLIAHRGVGGASSLLPSSSSWVARKAGQLLIRSSRRPVPTVIASASNGREGVAPEMDYGPPADFYKVEAIVRPWRVSHCASALLQSGIRGVTVSDVRGFGSQGGSTERHGGSEFSEDSFVAKVKLEVVVSKDQVEVVVSTIIDQARTGEIGDGKIFIIPVADVIRVRTGERGLKAERMAGGRADLLSPKTS